MAMLADDFLQNENSRQTATGAFKGSSRTQFLCFLFKSVELRAVRPVVGRLGNICFCDGSNTGDWNRIITTSPVPARRGCCDSRISGEFEIRFPVNRLLVRRSTDCE